MNSIVRPADNFFMRQATAIAIIIVTLLMAMSAVIFYNQERAGRLAKDWVEHSYQVSMHTQVLFGKLKDAEIGERGFLLTGRKEYLEPYYNAINDTLVPVTLPVSHFVRSKFNSDAEPNNLPMEYAVPDPRVSIQNELKTLRWLTSDNIAQQRNVDEMDGVIKELLAYWDDAIRVRKSNNSMAEVSQDTGKHMMDHVRILARVMLSEESRLLEMRSDADEANTERNHMLIYGGILFFYAALVLCIWLYQRTRARAAVQVLNYTQALEKSEEELKMQQEELKASNEEIEASNEELEEKTRALEEQNTQIRRQTEELEKSRAMVIQKAQEVEQASKYKSEFLANMSHELRTPLNSLLILAKLLAANEEGNLTAEQVEEARVIHNGGLELLNLINDILDLSKVEAGKLTITADDVYIDNIVKQMQRQFAPVARESGVAFPVKIADDTPSLMRTDAQRVEQILKNLISNAFKFTERGHVALEVGRPDAKLSLQRPHLDRNNTIAFTVEDTGIGIESSKLNDIFEAFQQENGSIDRHYGGTGLGLTIARKFAHMLGGEIHVTSAKGKGSRFTLILPVSLEPSTESSEPAETVLSEPVSLQQEPAEPVSMPMPSAAEFVSDDRKVIGEKDKVLLVIEDDPQFAGALMTMAHRHGYKCLIAGDGRSGILLATQAKITAIILDLKLPDIDGMQVLEQLKDDLRTRHIPVHIISGREEPEGDAAPLRKGAAGYLRKPAEKEDIDRVFAKLDSLLPSQTKRLLVVEDDRKSQVAIESLLKKEGVQITSVNTGAAAFAQLAETTFDCIILDLRLPDMSGFEWLEQAEKSPPKNGLPPVIVYTAKELTEDENRDLHGYTGSIIIKGAKSPERLLDEVTLFLHSVESTLSREQQDIIRMQHNPDKVLQRRTILLVDDDLRNTFALSKLLKKHGMNIVIADNGQMALDKLREDPSIELVIMDIMMPIMDGYQAIREIRSQKAYARMPIIALTARAMPQEQEKCMEAGANDYMTKPVDIERLLTLLRVWLFRQEKAA
ncbi:MAG TPA: response regulator [Rickettsiales bacterium]|nr:response regulator [Rickettsiales bacterium]